MYRFTTAILFFLTLCFPGYGQFREIVTIAGSSTTGNFGGDGGKADSALLSDPNDVAADLFGNVYIEDYYNFRIRKVNSLGYISTFAGTGTGGYSGDNGLAPSANMKPNGVTTDRHGNVYISDNSSNVVRKVNAVTNIITLYAGSPWHSGATGDSGVAANIATLGGPRGMCVDSKGNLYIADVNNHKIRRVDTFGKIWTFAGNGLPFYSGDAGFARFASLDSPLAVAADKLDNIYIADYKNNVIRKVDTGGIITTVAGNNAYSGFSGDGLAATLAALFGPRGVAIDKYGYLYISDGYNNRIRMVDTAGKISTLAGNGTPGFGGDGGAAAGSNLYFPQGISVDTFRNLYIGDANNQRVRKIYVSTTGIGDISTVSPIHIYPNPVLNELYIEGLTLNDQVTIFSIFGRLVPTTCEVKNGSVHIFNLVDFVPGMYLLQVTDINGNRKAVARFVKE